MALLGIWSAKTCLRFRGWPTCRPARARPAPDGLSGGRRSLLYDGDESPAESGDKSPHSKNRAKQAHAPRSGSGFLELTREIDAEMGCFVCWTSSFRAPGLGPEERNGAHPQVGAGNFCERRDCQLTATAHRREEGAFSVHRGERGHVSEAGADFIHARVVSSGFDSDGGLTDAGKHFTERKPGRGETGRNVIAAHQFAWSVNDAESIQASGGEQDGVEFG